MEAPNTLGRPSILECTNDVEGPSKLDGTTEVEAAAAEQRAQVGGGGRSEKIRTYNFKENRVTDHRIGLTLYRLDRILAGDLDAVTDGLLADERTRQLADG